MPGLVITGLLLVGVVVFFTHALETVTGFGCTVLAFPFVIFLINDLEHAKILLSILAWLLAGYFAIAKRREINWRQFGIIAGLAGLGMPAGILIFKNMDANYLTRILGAFIVLSSAIQLVKAFFHGRTRVMPRFLFLIAGGIVHGAFAVGGPLIVLYTTHKITDKGQFRATMCLVWTTLNSVLLTQYLLEGNLTPELGRELLVMAPFLVAGIVAGEAVHKKINEHLFRKIVFASLFLVGVIMAAC